MTIRQTLLKWTYPFLTFYSRLRGIQSRTSTSAKPALVPFYELSVLLNNGTSYSFSALKNKKVLIVNTASDCGYTNQYDGLQKLYELHRGKLELIAFPSNDFKEQEKLNDNEIASFCKINFGVTFPLVKKSVVKKSTGQNEVFQWLTDKNKNGWNNRPPSWNFCKYIIDEKGNLTHFFEAAEEPSGKKIKLALGLQL
ncbi:MAG TPA: glutathione peroxidase [Ferruginibacter sp.]|nr:glutathione peroxidase [Ferruginibacter sp.]